MKPFRVGMGYDVHRMVSGRKCVIGGVEFDYEKGPDGHSEGDVLLHAICDALLGAVNLGDIGQHFPDTSADNKDLDSKIFLRYCYGLVKEKGYTVNNLDTIVICERPKMAGKKEEMQRVIAENLEVDVDLVSIKATTEEKMGFTGNGDGIKAWAYVSLAKNQRHCEGALC